MLPDYPHIKKLVQQAYLDTIEKARQMRLGAFRDVRVTQMHEGTKSSLRREDGATTSFDTEELTASAQVKASDPNEPLTAEQIQSLSRDLGTRMAEAQIKMILSRMDEAVEEVGNVTAPGLSMVEQIIQTHEMIEVDFDNDEQPAQLHAMFGSQEMVEKYHEAMAVIENDPVLRKRYEVARSQQLEKWRDRENSRKLVE